MGPISRRSAFIRWPVGELLLKNDLVGELIHAAVQPLQLTFAELLTRIYMDGRRRRIYTVARPKVRMARHVWSGPQPIAAQSKVLQ